jgi:UDP-glucose 4-epimerase
MSKILVIGGAGFVGSHLCEAELEAGNDVCCYDISDKNKVAHIAYNPKLCILDGDILDTKLLDCFVEASDIVYHLAAIANPKTYCEDPALVLKVDLEGTQEVVKSCWRHNKKLVFASTSEIYGKNPSVPWSEESDRVLGPCSTPRWSYASSKAIGEHYCYAYGAKGLRFTIVRFFNFYGPRLDSIGSGRVIPCFIKSFLSGDQVDVCAPGTQTRCFTYIDDGIRGIRAAARHKGNTSFNFGTDREVSMIELAEMMKSLGGFKSEIRIIPASQKYGRGYEDILRRAPDCSKANKELGWWPKVELEEGLMKTIEYYKDVYANHNNAA